METKEILICLFIVVGLLISTIYVLKLFFLNPKPNKKNNKTIYKTSKHKSIIAYSDDDTFIDTAWKEMLRDPK